MISNALLDTSILIKAFNEDRSLEKLEVFFSNLETNLFLSAVVFNEFVRGCHDSRSMEIAHGLLIVFVGRLITPSENNWIECAQITERLLKQKKRNKQDILLLQNDILIALSARDHQAKLITSNKKDFQLLEKIILFTPEYW